MADKKSIPNRRYDLEERLIKFAGITGELLSTMEKSSKTKNLIDQLMRSSESAALNYGEAQVAESKADFIHKIGIVLKELKESRVALKIIKIRNLYQDKELHEKCDQECSELVAIFITSVKTARSN